MKKILIACEYSGIVRAAFAKLGWDAWSCDILPSDIPGNHIQGDVIKVLNQGWDMMIAFPPCTYLAYSGMASWYDEGRAMKRIKAAEFFMKLFDSKISHVCVENPQGIMTKIFRKPDMMIHPYYFGDRDMKRTCLWLKNLPPLEYRLKVDLFGQKTATEKPEPYGSFISKKTGRKKNMYFTNYLDENNKFKTGHERSKTFPSIAKAMAEQWTEFFETK